MAKMTIKIDFFVRPSNLTWPTYCLIVVKSCKRLAEVWIKNVAFRTSHFAFHTLHFTFCSLHLSLDTLYMWSSLMVFLLWLSYKKCNTNKGNCVHVYQSSINLLILSSISIWHLLVSVQQVYLKLNSNRSCGNIGWSTLMWHSGIFFYHGNF